MLLEEEALTRPAVLAPALLVLAYAVYQLFLRPSGLPAGLPILGAKPGEWFPLVRARFRNVRDMKTAIQLAYTQHRDQACILPVFGSGDLVLLPSKEIQWLVDQPDSEVDIHQAIVASLQLDHVVMDSHLMHPPVHHKIVSTLLTRETGNLVPDLLDEIRFTVDKLWGVDTNAYRELCVYDVMRPIIGQVTNRVFVGLPLCRDQNLLDAGIAYAQALPFAGLILRFIPSFIRPLLAPLVTLACRLHTRRFYRIITPEITRRLRAYEARAADTPEARAKAKAEEPNDFLQWSLRYAKETLAGTPYQATAAALAGRVLLLNFASIHTSSFTVTHVLLDLACAQPRSRQRSVLDALRAEIRDVLAAHGGRWNKRALADMRRLDSVFRESQRLNSFIVVATARAVVAREGVLTPSGVRVAPGNTLCGPAYPVFHDAEVYADPEEFKPFRFAEMRAEEDDCANGDGGKAGGGGGGGEAYVKKARQAFATTSPEYVAFGHGRHACPGRFFASSELKLMLAYLIMHYDFEPQPSRPENVWFGLTRIPPMQATIRVKRREGVDFGLV